MGLKNLIIWFIWTNESVGGESVNCGLVGKSRIYILNWHKSATESWEIDEVCNKYPTCQNLLKIDYRIDPTIIFLTWFLTKWVTCYLLQPHRRTFPCLFVVPINSWRTGGLMLIRKNNIKINIFLRMQKATYISELYQSEFAQFRDTSICGFTLQKQLTQSHFRATKQGPHLAGY